MEKERLKRFAIVASSHTIRPELTLKKIDSL